jgi:beta-galactosidase GanA
MTLLIADEEGGWRFWQDGDVLVRGPQLLRSAELKGGRLALTGDTAAASPLEVWAPRAARSITWNGARVRLAAGQGGSRVATADLAGPREFAVPQLTDWRVAAGSPEAAPDFDDSAWQAIDRRAYASTTARPDGEPNMLMDAYGFHEGDVWYRGRFTGTPDAERIRLYYGAGGTGMVQVFLDGQLVGQEDLPWGLPRPVTTGNATFDLPDAARTPGEHVIAAMVRNNGHNWDLDADDFHKEARGLVSVSVEPKGGRSYAIPLAWKIQGRQGGEDIVDPVRGVPNNGGLYGERQGWHLPGFDDRQWQRQTAPASDIDAGTTWYRTKFDLAVPEGQDATLGVQFGDPSVPRSEGEYRVLIFVNGWHMGQFIAHVGPQRTFPVPEGILNHRGRNTLALAVTSDGEPGNALEPVRLVTLRNVRGGLEVDEVEAPATLAD